MREWKDACTSRTCRPHETQAGTAFGRAAAKVAIARVLAAEPSIILADEPTGNLDSSSGAEIMGIIKGLHQAGNTIVLITHDSSVAGQAQRKVYVHDGILTEREART